MSKSHTLVSLVLCIGLFLWAGVAQAAHHSVLLSGGKTTGGQSSVRIGLARDLGLRLEEWSTGYASLSVEGGAGLWSDSGHTAASLDICPMLTAFFFQGSAPVLPFVEGGIGGSYTSDDHFGGRKLGSHLLFRDVLGLGAAFGPSRRHIVRARYVHYSNANLADENDGINFFVLSLGISF